MIYLDNKSKENEKCILGKCKSRDDAELFFEKYKSCNCIFAFTSLLLIKSSGDNQDINYFFDTARLELRNMNKNKINSAFLNSYIENECYLNRAGGVDVNEFAKNGFTVSGDINTFRGLCHFEF